MVIEIGKVGEVVAGDNMGWYVLVQDDIENTGGYLILQSRLPDMSEGFDDWVENTIELEKYFKESSWEIQWKT